MKKTQQNGKDIRSLWKADTKSLFEEILECGGPGVRFLNSPLKIIYGIMQEGAQRAIELQDEKMISIFARLGVYEAATDTKHHDHKKICKLIEKFA